MRRDLRLVLPLVAGLAAAGLACAAPAQAATWHTVGCTNLDFSGAKICFYWATGHQAQGKLINHSSHDINNQGIFDHVSGSGSSLLCGRVTTKAGTTATCTRTVAANSTYRLADNYIGPNLQEESAQTASHHFTS